MIRAFGWIVLSTFALGSLVWLFLVGNGLKGWALCELGVLCVSILINREYIQRTLNKKKR